MEERIQRCAARLSKHPELLKSVESILDITEDTHGYMELADDVEEKVISEMSKLGNRTLHTWAENKSTQKAESFGVSKKGRKNSKKN